MLEEIADCRSGWITAKERCDLINAEKIEGCAVEPLFVLALGLRLGPVIGGSKDRS